MRRPVTGGDQHARRMCRFDADVGETQARTKTNVGQALSEQTPAQDPRDDRGARVIAVLASDDVEQPGRCDEARATQKQSHHGCGPHWRTARTTAAMAPATSASPPANIAP